MNNLNKKLLRNLLIGVGLTISVVGLGIHLIAPSDMKNSYMKEGKLLSINPEGYTVEYIKYKQNPLFDQYLLYLIAFINPTTPENCLILFLNETEFERFNQSIPIEDLIPIKSLEGYYEASYNSATFESLFIIDVEEDIYLIIINENENEIFPFYFYSLTSPTYYSGLIIFSIGLIFAVGILVWYLEGWKRYLMLGISINLVIFLFRITTLPILYNMESQFKIISMELYNDYQFFYMYWTEAFTKGFWPYSEGMLSYIYPPLFILTIGIFGFIPIPAWKMAIPIFLFNIGSGYLVYLIVKKITKNEKYSIYSMIIYFLNPFTLMYGSYTGLNPTPFVFFVILSFYLALVKRNSISMLALGIATMYKQFAIIFLPLIILTIINQYHDKKIYQKLKKMIFYSMIYGMTILLISLPFLIVDYQAYLNRVYLTHTGYSIEMLTTFHPETGWPVNFNSFFLLIRAPEFLTIPIAYLLSYYILLGTSMLFIYIYYFKKYIQYYKSSKIQSSYYSLFIESLFWSIALIICLQLFYPRGSYKFYLMLLVPFISIFFDFKNINLEKTLNTQPFKFQKRFLAPLIISWVIFFCFRHIYFWILLAWLIYYVIRKVHSSSIKKQKDIVK